MSIPKIWNSEFIKNRFFGKINKLSSNGKDTFGPINLIETFFFVLSVVKASKKELLHKKIFKKILKKICNKIDRAKKFLYPYRGENSLS